MMTANTTVQAQLPSERQESTIEGMQPGDSGWTVPWAMYADAGAAMWLNGRYSIKATPGGTVQMRVWREESDGCWRVDASRCRDHRWSLGGSGYVGTFRAIPVSELSFEPH